MDVQESIERFGAPLTGLLISWGMPAVDAAELAQDSLADAHLSIGACRGDASSADVFGAWLRGIARNKYRNWVRSRSRNQKLATATDPQVLDQIGAAAEEANERILQLRREIERLPIKQREVVMMHYLDATSIADVAALLCVSVKSVEGRLYQARKMLRKRMAGSGSWTQVAKAVLL